MTSKILISTGYFVSSPIENIEAIRNELKSCEGFSTRKEIVTDIHVLKNDKCLCGYIPRKEMEFDLICNGIDVYNISCDICQKKVVTLINNNCKNYIIFR